MNEAQRKRGTCPEKERNLPTVIEESEKEPETTDTGAPKRSQRSLRTGAISEGPHRDLRHPNEAEGPPPGPWCLITQPLSASREHCGQSQVFTT